MPAQEGEQPMMWRHGDVLIASVQTIPADARQRRDVTLARGEVTGHSHRVEAPDTADLWQIDGQLVLRVVADSARIVHDEHKAITLPRGVYQGWMQRENVPPPTRPVPDGGSLGTPR